jgi:hypothetical protein
MMNQSSAGRMPLPNLVGTINMFYIVKNPGNLDEVYFSVTNRPILRMTGDLYIVASVRAEDLLSAFRFFYDRDHHGVAHVDAIVAKIMLVPHYNQSRDEALRRLQIKALGRNASVDEHPPPCPSSGEMCGIKMWDAR